MSSTVRHAVALETRLRDTAEAGFNRVAEAGDRMASRLERAERRVQTAATMTGNEYVQQMNRIRTARAEIERKFTEGGGRSLGLFKSIRGAAGMEELAVVERAVARHVAGIEREAARAEASGRRIGGAMSTAFSLFAGGAGLAIGLQVQQQIRELAFSFDELASHAERLNKLEIKTGFDVESIQGLEFAARQTDTSFEALVVGLRTLARQVATDSPIFDALGVSVRDTTGHLRDQKAILFDVADAFATSSDEASELAVVTKLLGARGQEWLPILEGGRAALAKWIETARESGVVIEEHQIRRLAELDDALDRLRGKWEGFVLNIKLGIAEPVIAVMTGDAERKRHAAVEQMFARQVAQEKFPSIGGATDPNKLPMSMHVQVMIEAKRRADEYFAVLQKIEEEEARARKGVDRVADAVRRSEELEKAEKARGAALEKARREEERMAEIRKDFALQAEKLVPVHQQIAERVEEIAARWKDGEISTAQMRQEIERASLALERMRKAGPPAPGLPAADGTVPVPPLRHTDGARETAGFKPETWERLAKLRDEVGAMGSIVENSWDRIGSSIDNAAARWSDRIVQFHGFAGEVIETFVETAIAQLLRLAVLDIFGGVGGRGGGMPPWLQAIFGFAQFFAGGSPGGGGGGGGGRSGPPDRWSEARQPSGDMMAMTEGQAADSGGVAGGQGVSVARGTSTVVHNHFNALTVPTILDAMRSPFGSLGLAEAAEFNARQV